MNVQKFTHSSLCLGLMLAVACDNSDEDAPARDTSTPAQAPSAESMATGSAPEDESRPDEPDTPGDGPAAPPNEGQPPAPIPSPDPPAGENLNVCERLIACATAAVVPVTPLQAVYGEQGSCWHQFDEQDCLIDCASQLDAMGAMHPELDACLQCDDDSDCSFYADTPVCAPSGSCCVDASSCVGRRCDNGQLDPGEDCDGEDFGTNTCATFGYANGSLFCLNCQIAVARCWTCGDGETTELGEEHCDTTSDGRVINREGATVTCEDFDSEGGTLRCTDDCRNFDPSGCF